MLRVPGSPERRREPQEPLCVLLLPARLERFAQRELAEDLLAAPGALAVEPATVGTLRRAPGMVRETIAAMQGRRMKLPGVPRAIVVFDALQYPLARALIAERREAELWYGGERPERGALRILHEAATDRAALTFSLAPLAGEERARDRTHALYERMEALGIESGRLGSERTR